MRYLRLVLFFALMIPTIGYSSSTKLNILCKETAQKQHDINDLKLEHSHNSSKTYRVADGKLFITNPGEKEYLYNEVKMLEHNLLQSGHMLLRFNRRFDGMTSALIGNSFLTIRRFECKKMSKGP